MRQNCHTDPKPAQHSAQAVDVCKCLDTTTLVLNDGRVTTFKRRAQAAKAGPDVQQMIHGDLQTLVLSQKRLNAHLDEYDLFLQGSSSIL